jgi:hypothetical protein
MVNNDMSIGFTIGFTVGVIASIVVMAGQVGQHMENYEVCQRTIQYQLDKTPEEVQTLMQTEKKREGR